MNQARTSIVTERRKPPGSFNQICVNRTACAVPLQTITGILIVLATTTGLQADHNKLLQLELKRGISRHLACDSEGYCYLLLPSPDLEGGRDSL